jgi:hypothetical protein
MKRRSLSIFRTNPPFNKQELLLYNKNDDEEPF